MFKPLLNLIYPSVCYACGKSVSASIQNICLGCRNDLSRLRTNTLNENPIEKIFWGRLHLIRATSYLTFEKNGKIQTLLHALKYKGINQVGLTLGKMAALELKETNFFEGIDLLLPVPIHKIKQEKRGYNQSHSIADGIAEVTGLKVDKSSLIKEVNTTSQTKKNRYERFKNVNQTFTVTNEKELRNCHLLLIDDVLTTGATIEACGNALKNIDGVRLSLLTIAYTY